MDTNARDLRLYHPSLPSLGYPDSLLNYMPKRALKQDPSYLFKNHTLRTSSKPFLKAEHLKKRIAFSKSIVTVGQVPFDKDQAKINHPRRRSHKSLEKKQMRSLYNESSDRAVPQEFVGSRFTQLESPRIEDLEPTLPKGHYSDFLSKLGSNIKKEAEKAVSKVERLRDHASDHIVHVDAHYNDIVRDLNMIGFEAAALTTKGKLLSVVPWVTRAIETANSLLSFRFVEVKRLVAIKNDIISRINKLGKFGVDVSKTDNLAEIIEKMIISYDSKVQEDKVREVIDDKKTKQYNKIVDEIKLESDPNGLINEISKLRMESSQKITFLQHQLKDLEIVSSRYDHDRRNFREKFLHQKISFDELNKTFKVIEEENQRLASELRDSTRKKNKHLETAMMQLADLESSIFRNKKQRSRYFKLAKENSDLKLEISKMSVENNAFDFGVRADTFDRDEILLKAVRTSRSDLKTTLPLSEMLSVDPKAQVIDTRIERPPLVNYYIDSYEDYMHESSKNGGRRKTFDYLVLAKVRAIFDSRYFEFVSNFSRGYNHWEFSEFTFWWLGRYQIGKRSRKIEICDGNVDGFERIE